MNTKGQGLSVNVIIIAAIALVVMVILIVLVLRSAGLLGTSDDCSSLGEEGIQWVCVDPSFETCDDYGMNAVNSKECKGSTSEAPLRCCISAS